MPVMTQVMRGRGLTRRLSAMAGLPESDTPVSAEGLRQARTLVVQRIPASPATRSTGPTNRGGGENNLDSFFFECRRAADRHCHAQLR